VPFDRSPGEEQLGCDLLVGAALPHQTEDLTAGSGLTFEDRGEHELKGFPDRWHLCRAVSE